MFFFFKDNDEKEEKLPENHLGRVHFNLRFGHLTYPSQTHTKRYKIHGNPAKLYFVFIKTNPPNI